IIVIATLALWKFHLPVAFLGVGAFLLTRTLDISHFIAFASLDLIVFLIGMMVLVGLLREVDFFTWVLEKILLIRNLNAFKLFLLIIGFSLVLTSLVGQVASIIFMTSLVLEICSFFSINPMPFIMITLMSTNIASAGTMLGSPAGILLSTHVGFHFQDFLLWSFPVMLLCLVAGSVFLWVWYRGELRMIDSKIREIAIEDRTFRQLISVPATTEIKEELLLLGIVLLLLSLHYHIERFFLLPPNTLLIAIPLVGAGIAMGWKREEARVYIEEHVDWWTIVFFILFFAKAGTFKYTGITNLISSFLEGQVKVHPLLLITEVTWISSIASSVMDNVVVVSILIPAIKALQTKGVEFYLMGFLWWSLFLGGCFGSNITMIGSPANIVALGMLEKHKGIKISFLQWIKVGFLLSLLTTALAWGELVLISGFFSLD
ncbi:hypothetical protein J7K97_07115, partial [Candidatus Aerophobetes bacterium]|nr:hypothetical protein [Candidatus Aerophobetes bacterium]